MPTPSYVLFDDALPTAASKSLSDIMNDINSNELALADMVQLGERPGTTTEYTYFAAPNDQRVSIILLKRDPVRFRKTYTYGTSGPSNNKPTQVVIEWSNDSGATWAPVDTKTFTWITNGEGNVVLQSTQ